MSHPSEVLGSDGPQFCLISERSRRKDFKAEKLSLLYADISSSCDDSATFEKLWHGHKRRNITHYALYRA